MDKYKIKDLKERLDKESNQEHKNKMLYMWIKQDHISLSEYNELVKNHGVSHHDSDRTICKECQKKAIVDMMRDAEENDMYDL